MIRDDEGFIFDCLKNEFCIMKRGGDVTYKERKRLVRSFLGKIVEIEIDRPIGYIHKKEKYELHYPINYGYIPNVYGGDGEELDVYLIGVDKPVKTYRAKIIGVVHRHNDVEDKLVACPISAKFDQARIQRDVEFQEKYYESHVEPLYHKSCGAIIYRENNGVREYLVLFQKGSKTCSFPKGHIEFRETEEQTAVREVLEETGLKIDLIDGFRKTLFYRLPPKRIKEKTVVLFLAKTNETPKINKKEIIDFKWCTYDESLKILANSYAGPLIDADEFLNKCSLVTI